MSINSVEVLGLLGILPTLSYNILCDTDEPTHIRTSRFFRQPKKSILTSPPHNHNRVLFLRTPKTFIGSYTLPFLLI